MKYKYLISFLKLSCLLLLCLEAGAQSTNPSPYCYPTATGMTAGTCTGNGGAFGYGFSIQSFTLNTISRTGNCYGSGNTDVYRYWNNTTTLNGGEKYSLEIVTPQSVGFSVSAGAWIDYNQNNTFDSLELIGVNFVNNNNVAGGVRHKFTFTVPCNATAGTTRLRVRAQSSILILGNQACASPSTYGETWDFAITIWQPTSVNVGFTIPTNAYVKTSVSMVNDNQVKYTTNTWDINNDGTIEAQNALNIGYTWTSGGTKCVKLKTKNCYGTDSIVKCLSIVSPTVKPVADFKSCIRVIDRYETVQLFDQSTNGPWQWTWSVIDSLTYASSGWYPYLGGGEVTADPNNNGNDEHSKNPEFSFDVPGTYAILLQVKNDIGTSSTVMKRGYIKVLLPTTYHLGFGAYGPKYDNVVTSDYGTLYDDGGLFGKYGNSMGMSSKSYMVLEPASGLPVTIKFKNIKLNNSGDSITVYDDNKRNASKILGTYTAADNGTYPTLTSTEGKMFVYFGTDNTGTDSGFVAEYFAQGHDPGAKSFGLGHNVLKIGKQASFYSKYNNLYTGNFGRKWKVDGVAKPLFENRDTMTHVFSDTMSHQVCLEFASCDTSFTICTNLQFDQGIIGKVYKDVNSNCALNSGDEDIGQLKVSLYDNSNNFISSRTTEKDGSFDFPVGLGQYKLVLDTLDGAFRVNCKYPGFDSAFTLASGNPLIDNINFAMECKPGFDIGVKSVGVYGLVFPGRQHQIRVLAGDLAKWHASSCSNMSGQVKITVTGKVSYLSKTTGSLTPSVSGKVFTYSISNFANVNLLKDFGLVFNTDTSGKSTDSVVVEVEVTPTSGDNDSSNNRRRFVYKVRNSYDPNIKEVYPENIKPGYKDWLTYTVHFQNTGTAPAFDVRIADTLDTQLDLETFEVIGYSHYVNTSLTGRVLSFTFKDIMLADSFSDEKASHGYIQYRIKPKPGLPAGVKIKNTAYIYFDFNEAVVTNTTTNEFVKDNYVIIPDPNFVVWLTANFPSCMNGNRMDTTCNDILVSSVNVSGLDIATLEGIQYFKSLILLNCSDNKLQDLPPMHALFSLDCSNNKFTQLPAIDVSNSLLCGKNLMTSLPALSGNLLLLDCRDNLLTTLPSLPNDLSELNCSGNQLTTLPTLPYPLRKLYCKDNKLNSIPDFPLLLETLDCSNNFIKCFPEFPSLIKMIAIVGNTFTCLPNYLPVMNSGEKDFPLCKKNDTFNNPNGCLSLITSVDETSVSRVMIYPNPGTGIFSIQLPMDMQVAGCSIEVYNLMGQMIHCSLITGESTQIDLSLQPAGVYIIKVNGLDFVLNACLIKQ